MSTAQDWRPIPGFPGYACCRSTRARVLVRNSYGYILTPLRGEEAGCYRLVGPWGVAVRSREDLLALAFPEEQREPERECVVCGIAFTPQQHNQTHCPACSRKVAQKNGVYLNSKRAGTSQRRCHDCGKPTTDYRCPACWDKLRAGRDGYCADAYEDVL